MDLDLELGTRRTAHEIVRNTLRQAILKGSLTGGERLVQADIARRLNVSTTPVREALRDLATEGLIQLDPHRGAIVKRLTPEELREVHYLCKLLEPEAMKHAAGNLTPDQIETAGRLIAEMDDETDTGRWADLNRAFHAVLAEGVPLPRLVSILGGLRDTAAPYVALALEVVSDHFAEANKDHRELLEAVTAGDKIAAARINRRHVDLTIRVFDSAQEILESAGNDR